MPVVMILAYALAFVLLAYLFANLYKAESIPLITRFDNVVLSWADKSRSEVLDAFFLTMTWAGSSYFLSPVTVLLASWLVWRRAYGLSAFLVIGFGGAALLSHLIKLLVERERPVLFPQLVDTALTLGFPSGHATHIAAFSLALYLVVRRTTVRWNLAAAILLGAIALLIALSRIYLQVHYPTDVLAGLGIGIFWVIGVDAILRRFKIADAHKRTG